VTASAGPVHSRGRAVRCDVVAVGTELLLGQIVDSNSAWIGEQLAANGIATNVHVKVGDNVSRIVGVMRERLVDADALIVCGGLGPTHDDLTREAIACVMGDVVLVLDDVVADRIAELFAARGRRMSENNLRQALVPAGAEVIPQRVGTAPGLICPVVVDGVGKVIFAVPGVPSEMREMFERAVLPELVARSGGRSVIRSRVIKVWGESESGLNARLDDVIARLDAAGDPTLAFLARGWNGLEIRLTSRQLDVVAADAAIAPWEREIRDRLGIVVFGTDGDSMESVVLDLLRQRGLSLGLAESLTAGMVAARLAGVSGASDVLRGAVVSYASDVKFDVLGVTPGPVISEPAAREMAEGARRVLGADVGLGLTGVAGPRTQEDVPVGTVCLAVAGPACGREVTLRLGQGDRQHIREMAVINALDLLRRHLLR
jgi:competence/damage-inducible protein CinA-like protein